MAHANLFPIRDDGEDLDTMDACAQADAMTADELAAFRAKVRELLCNPEQPLAYNFAEEDLAACGIAQDSAPPFAVIASAELDRSVGRWPLLYSLPYSN